MERKHLFGTDGIRAVIGEYPLHDETIRLIGMAAADVLQKAYGENQVVIGCDTRISGQYIMDIVIESLLDGGCSVLDAGVFPTPGVSFLSRQYHCPGIVISASHNAYEWNGIKFMSSRGEKVSVNIEEQIEARVYQPQKQKHKRGKRSDIQQQGGIQYMDFLRQQIPQKDIDIACSIDCANGSTYSIAQKIFGSIVPHSNIVHCQPNGKNINHQCGALHPRTVSPGVCVMAFDGDGDRIILVDENGIKRDGDYILGILAYYYKRHGLLHGNIVVPTVMSNLGLLKFFEKQGIGYNLAPVGDRHVYEQMTCSHAILGGEQSGHIILLPNLPTGDGMMIALKLLSIMQEQKSTMADLCAQFSLYPQVLKNLPIVRKPKLENIFDKGMVEEIEKEVQGRVLIRYSGTEPLLRIMVEGKEKTAIEQKAQELQDIFISFVEKNG